MLISSLNAPSYSETTPKLAALPRAEIFPNDCQFGSVSLNRLIFQTLRAQKILKTAISSAKSKEQKKFNLIFCISKCRIKLVREYVEFFSKAWTT